MLKKDDLINLAGKSADTISEKLKEIGGGSMGNAPIKIYDSGKINGVLEGSIISASILVVAWAIPKLYHKAKKCLHESKQKIDDSKQIHNILSNIDDDEDDNNIKNMEEQL